MTERFYADLPVLGSLEALGEPGNFARLPGDWYVAMSDVRDSTTAIESGAYKKVNTLGAATITAVLNAARGLEIPFVFGGDGSTLCVPPGLLEDARAALLQTRELAQRSFGLELRIGTLPVSEIDRAGFAIWVARYRVSDGYVQAVFAGGGMGHADRLLKDPASADAWSVKPGSTAPRGSFEGLECRWQDIPSPRGETVSLMVRAMSAEPARERATYLAVIARVREVYGDDEASHPIAAPNLRLAFDSRRLEAEVGVRASSRGALGRWLYLNAVRATTLLGALAMKLGLRAGGTDWGGYKEAVVRNTDVRKFSDHYSQILSGTAAQRAALSAWLDERFARGELVYGLHVSDRAHITCLVFDYSGRHLHFIDGADGGLFLAAKAYKKRLMNRGQSPIST